MTQFLHIDSSPRGERSHSRALSGEFITAWRAIHPNDIITYRDLGHNPVPHVNENLLTAIFTPPETHSPEATEAIAISDRLVDEFLAADRYVLGIPMYNFCVPSTFKAYIDQIVRAGKTFNFTKTGYEGLVKGKKMLVITSRGGVYAPGSPGAAFDFQETYLRAIFGFLGVIDITFINAENLNLDDDSRALSLANASAAVVQAASSW